MGKETERKFLVNSDAWKQGQEGVHIRQYYLQVAGALSVRLRITDRAAWLCIKGPTKGISRAEFEYLIPQEDALAIVSLGPDLPGLEKTRYLFQHAGFQWEIDEFHGKNKGLVVAEIELPAEDTPFEKPEWAGKEVSGDPRYANSNLARTPFQVW